MLNYLKNGTVEDTSKKERKVIAAKAQDADIIFDSCKKIQDTFGDSSKEVIKNKKDQNQHNSAKDALLLLQKIQKSKAEDAKSLPSTSKNAQPKVRIESF